MVAAVGARGFVRDHQPPVVEAAYVELHIVDAERDGVLERVQPVLAGHVVAGAAAVGGDEHVGGHATHGNNACLTRVARVDRLYAGIDLAWSATGAGRTGLAAVDDAGALVSSATVRSDDEIAAWLDALPGRVVVAGVDAPLVVPNESGQRAAETAIARAFGAFKVGAHTSNRGRPGMNPPRAETLARRFGWQVAPTHRGSPDFPACIEVYPHPAMVALFGLTARLTYKGKFPVEVRREAFADLLGHLEGIDELCLTDGPGHADWARLRSGVSAAATQAAFDAVEDEIDAVLCAHLAWRWHHHPETLQVYPSLREWEDGYIVAPPAPLVGRKGRLTVEVELAEYDAVRAAIAGLPGVRSVR